MQKNVQKKAVTLTLKKLLANRSLYGVFVVVVVAVAYTVSAAALISSYEKGNAIPSFLSKQKKEKENYLEISVGSSFGRW